VSRREEVLEPSVPLKVRLGFGLCPFIDLECLEESSNLGAYCDDLGRYCFDLLEMIGVGRIGRARATNWRCHCIDVEERIKELAQQAKCIEKDNLQKEKRRKKMCMR
jgi:hypothetical protein